MKLLDYGGEDMIGDLFLSLGKGIGLLFLQPFLYVYLLLILWIGFNRVKRERKQFSYRIFDSFEELRQSFIPGLVVGLSISIVTILVGIALPKSALLLLTIMMVTIGIFLPLWLLTPSFIFGSIAILMILFPSLQERLNLEWSVADGTVVFLIGSFIILAEAILLRKTKKGTTTPLILEGKRGMKVGAHLFQRAWLLPVFILIPGDSISSMFDFWPVLSIGASQFDLLLFPIGIGFHHVVKSALPVYKIEKIGMELTLLSILCILLAIGGLFEPYIAVGGALVAIIGRIFISVRATKHEEESGNIFMPAHDGVVILSIIPKSLAERMELTVGEKIVKVNGVFVKDEQSFYKAVEKNRALCKLEVIDVQGEIRIVQKATYTDDHHELGIILA